MRSKFHSRVIGCLFLLCVDLTFAESPASSPFVHDQLGRCFASSHDALTAIYGVDGAVDENVVVQGADVTPGSQWIIDKTADHNYQWYLLEQLKGQNCVTLYIPFASEVRSIHRQRSVSVIAHTQASPGGNQYGMLFRRSPGLGRFVPVKCTRTAELIKSPVASTNEINCLAVGD